jgi:hypothetical protein
MLAAVFAWGDVVNGTLHGDGMELNGMEWNADTPCGD